MTCTAAMNGAESVTYKQAREMKTPISEIALYSGLRCATIEIAQPIAIPANKMNSKASIVFVRRRSEFRLQADDLENCPPQGGLRTIHPPQPVAVFKRRPT